MKSSLLKTIGFLLAALLSFAIYAQEADEEAEFNKLFYEITVHIGSDNPAKGLYLADSIYQNATNPRHKIKALMLSAALLTAIQKPDEAVETTLKALTLAQEEEDYANQASIYGMLSSLAIRANDLEKGRAYLEQVLQTSDQITNEQQKIGIRGNAFHEMSSLFLEEKNYQKAYENSIKSIDTFKKVIDENRRNYFLAMEYEQLGRIYLNLKQYVQALDVFKISLDYLKKGGLEKASLSISTYQGLGESYMMVDKLDSAGFYLDKARVSMYHLDNDIFKEIVYKSLVKYHEMRGSEDSARYFKARYDDVMATKEPPEEVELEYDPSEEKTASFKSFSGIVYVLIAVALLILAIAGIYLRRKRLEKNGSLKEVALSAEGVPDTTVDDHSSGLILSESTIKHLNKKMKSFEKDREFLNREMSFTTLAGMMNTNSKYLNLYLKEEKGKDYSSYINDLRINYIIDRLKKEKKVREYKLSYLAEMAGFSSYSSFAANFKRVKNCSPSEFLLEISKK